MEYVRPAFLFNAHLETIYPALFRTVKIQAPRRERFITSDDDFLDLDWYEKGGSRLVIISHGLEGNSTRAYIKGMAKIFLSNSVDVLAWNYRGCGDGMNRQLRFYHSGATDDLQAVIDHASKKYSDIALIGFSLGGNLTLKYLGENGQLINPAVRKAVAFSVPMDLHGSCQKISEPGNRIYARRFLKSLIGKVKAKGKVREGIDLAGIEQIKSLHEFDDRYTAPLHGFSNALEYYRLSSSLRMVDNITVPTLIVNAQNDPFLSATCYPAQELQGHPFVTFESPVKGGHVGFALFGRNGLYWSETRALDFLK